MVFEPLLNDVLSDLNRSLVKYREEDYINILRNNINRGIYKFEKGYCYFYEKAFTIKSTTVELCGPHFSHIDGNIVSITCQFSTNCAIEVTIDEWEEMIIDFHGVNHVTYFKKISIGEESILDTDDRSIKQLKYKTTEIEKEEVLSITGNKYRDILIK